MQQRDPSLFDSAEPTCWAVSPLAEGTDRIFAEQAIAVGFELCCVMPFPQAEFERDFAPGTALEDNSLVRFRHLASQAGARFELDGTRADEEAAYGAAGRVVLNQTDLLVLVWDGDRQHKRGGTEETLEAARLRGIPIVWVDAHSPHDWKILDAVAPLVQDGGSTRLSSASVDGGEVLLRKVVRALLELPNNVQQASPKSHEPKPDRMEDPVLGLKMFYAERQPRWTLAVVWKVFRYILGDRTRPRVEFSLAPFEEAVKNEWPANRTSAVGTMVDWMRPFYAWPDKLAVVYADRYRSAFILAFFLAAVAVGMALMPLGLQMEAHHFPETLFILSELFAIMAILCLVIVGRRSQWHERWINYRLTAELVRHLRLVTPLGGGSLFPQIPAQWATYGHPASTWMAWYVRAVERTAGLPTAIVNKEYLRDCLSDLSHLVSSQIEYHDITSRRSELIERRLHRFGVLLLLLTLLACGLHLLPNIWDAVHLPSSLPPLLVFLCGFLPALGAAIGGIVNQGEFRRIEKRSAAMREQLREIAENVNRLVKQIEADSTASHGQYSIEAGNLASDAARLWLNEVLDWRVVFMDRPLVPPG